ncbi:anti-restriction protein [Klebsiella pneumoniae]|nr:anti-restriction protein [Klebsiella pneumoniae]
MTSSVTVPAVYVGTYHQYNGGSIFGKWFDLTDFNDEDEFYDACRALHAAEDDPEFMFQDWEGIPSQFASESSVKWAFIEAFRQAQDEGRAAAFVAWADSWGTPITVLFKKIAPLVRCDCVCTYRFIRCTSGNVVGLAAGMASGRKSNVCWMLSGQC